MPEFTMISPAGYLVSINHPNYSNPDVFRPTTQSKGIFNTIGAMPLSGWLGRQGTIMAAATVGATGSARAIAFLVDRYPSPTKYIGIAVDSSNRPYAQMSVDGVGTVIGRSTSSGSIITAGSPINVRLAFNALAPVHNSWMAAFQIDDVTIGVWSTDPDTTWTPFIPAFLLVGIPPVGGISALNGAIRHVQLSEIAEIISRSGEETAEESISTTVAANSVIAASATVIYQESSAISSDSLCSGDLTP